MLTWENEGGEGRMCEQPSTAANEGNWVCAGAREQRCRGRGMCESPRMVMKTWMNTSTTRMTDHLAQQQLLRAKEAGQVQSESGKINMVRLQEGIHSRSSFQVAPVNAQDRLEDLM